MTAPRQKCFHCIFVFFPVNHVLQVNFSPLRLKVTVDENVQLTSPEPEVGDAADKMASRAEGLAQLHSRVEEISAQLRKVRHCDTALALTRV